MADDPKVKAMISEYNDKIADLYGGSAQNQPPAANVTLRSAVCGACHPEQAKSWQASFNRAEL